MPTGAQEIVPGVSENLWRADGIMNTKLADLTVRRRRRRLHHRTVGNQCIDLKVMRNYLIQRMMILMMMEI